MMQAYDYPPNYEAINQRFKLDQMDVKPFFAWNLTIYNPHRVPLTRALIEHERVHSARQHGYPAAWWDRYLADDTFRLIEELAAHVIEYKVLCEEIGARKGDQRAMRRQAMHLIASRLCSPMYGYQPRVPYDRAREYFKRALREAEKPTHGEVQQNPVINPNSM